MDLRRNCNADERARALEAGLRAARELTAAGRYYATVCNGVTSAMVETIGPQDPLNPEHFKPSSMDDLINAAHRAAREAARDEETRTPDSVAEAIIAATKELL